MAKKGGRPGAVLVDTDVFSFTGREGHCIGIAYHRHLRGRTLAVSFVTVGEVLTGAKRRNWSPVRIAEFNARLRRFVVVPFDLEVCERYAELGILKTEQGSDLVIASNDRWIAACALRHKLPLVTHNRRHFEGIPGLVVISEAPKPRQPVDGTLPLE